MRKSISGESSSRASLQEVLQRMLENVSRSIKYDSTFFVHKHTSVPIYTNTDHFIPLALPVRGNPYRNDHLVTRLSQACHNLVNGKFMKLSVGCHKVVGHNLYCTTL